MTESLLSIDALELQRVCGGKSPSPDETALLKKLDPKDRERYLLQRRMQDKAEMAALLSSVQNVRHQTALSVINNIR